MKTWATALLLGFLLSFTSLCMAQDASGEYAKATDAYKNHDYEKSCRRMNNFYEASKGFHAIPEDVFESLKHNGRSETSYVLASQQAENSHEPALACTEYFFQALYFATKGDGMREAKAQQSALLHREEMIEAADPGSVRPSQPPESASKGSSLSDVVEASKAASSGKNGTCATDEMMMRDKSLIPPCVDHLMTTARKQKNAHQWTIARINYSRAAQVNKMLGGKQDPAVAQETARALREIDIARRTAQ
jgi:hypothetical protein